MIDLLGVFYNILYMRLLLYCMLCYENIKSIISADAKSKIRTRNIARYLDIFSIRSHDCSSVAHQIKSVNKKKKY